MQNANEHSYRTPLENLLNSIKSNGIKIIHEPKSQQGQGNIRPDFKVYKQIDSKTRLSYNALVGFIECKNLGHNLNSLIQGKQIDKYLSVSPNIMLTDYNRFVLLRFDEVISDVTLFPHGIDKNLLNIESALDSKAITSFCSLINDFFNASESIIKTKQELVKVLSTQSFYLGLKAREYYKTVPRSSFHRFFEKTYETFCNITRYALSEEEFCDILGQSVVYGLLVAHLESESKDIEITQIESFINLLPKEFDLLKEFIYFSIPSFHIPPSIAYALENIKKTIALIDKPSLAKDVNQHIDTVAIYLYEDFLKAYDDLRGSEKRKEGGVFYTPESVVNAIVSSLDFILKNKLNCPKGFATPKVKVLDFALGTGSFLAKVFEKVLESETSKFFQISNIKDKFLKDIYGFEISFVPYIVAHIKLGQILKNAGFKDFSDENKLQIFLTNTLDLSKQADYTMSMPLVLLEEQDKNARKIKHKEDLLVILGNPPYNVKSKNKCAEILNLLKIYKPLNEVNIQPLDDDYIKFLRFAQWKLLERSYPSEANLFNSVRSHGAMGFITNNSFIWGRTHRKMRESLYKSFDEIYILNLHGDNAKDVKEDENVFNIRVGVCISLFIKYDSRHCACGEFGGSASNATLGRMSNTPHSQGDSVAQSHTAKQGEAAVSLVNTRIVESKTSADSKSDSESDSPSLQEEDSKICDEKLALCSLERGDKSKASINEAKGKLADFSRKDESSSNNPNNHKVFYFSTQDNGILKRQDKFNFLNEFAYKGLDSIKWRELSLESPYFWFIPRDLNNEEYEKFIPLAIDKALESQSHNNAFSGGGFQPS